MLLPLALAACAVAPASTPPAAQLAGVQSPSAACIVHVYRNQTSYHSLNPEKPFLYVGEERAGTLGVGQTQCLRLAPGKYLLSIRQPVLFMPGITSDRLEIEVQQGTPLYVRYAKEFRAVTGTGQMSSNSRLQLASEEEWRLRK